MDIFKFILMVLKKETLSGLTYGQVLATVAILISLFGIAIQTNIRMSQIEVTQKTALIRIEVLEEGRVANVESILRLDERNITDHRLIGEKLDRILFELSK
jgi:hypothetical protein